MSVILLRDSAAPFTTTYCNDDAIRGHNSAGSAASGFNLMVSRRRFLVIGLASVGVAVTTAACGSSSNGAAGPNRATDDFSGRFAQYDVADEPNGDLSKVVWPAFVTAAGPEVRRLYEFQITHGELMRYMPCFCGCGQNAGHRNNRDCYVKQVNADGSVVLDSMAPT